MPSNSLTTTDFIFFLISVFTWVIVISFNPSMLSQSSSTRISGVTLFGTSLYSSSSNLNNNFPFGNLYFLRTDLISLISFSFLLEVKYKISAFWFFPFIHLINCVFNWNVRNVVFNRRFFSPVLFNYFFSFSVLSSFMHDNGSLCKNHDFHK